MSEGESSRPSSPASDVWDAYWKRENEAPQRDDAMCLFIALLLNKTFEQLRRRSQRSAIEMGAGSGRASRYLNEKGAATAIFDLSEEALVLAEQVNRGVINPSRVVRGDLFLANPESVGGTYDLVWNAGVLEHFDPGLQQLALERMGGLTTDDGLVVALCPFEGSIFYRFGKFVLEGLNRFPYGREIPVRSLAGVLPPSMTLASEERSVGFLILGFNAFKTLANFRSLKSVGLRGQRLVTRVSVWLLNNCGPQVFAIDRLLSRLFGGYLLLTVAKRTRSGDVSRSAQTGR